MKLKFYTGGYSTPLPTGDGIYIGKAKGIVYNEWDSKTGEVKTTDYPQAVNPSYLLLSKNGKVLYCVNELDAGTVESYAVSEDGTLSFINRVSTEGSCPCHIALSSEGDILAVTNYMSGSAIFYKVMENGGIGDLIQKFRFTGAGNHPARQEAAHTHSTLFDGDYCYIFELGEDRIYRLKTEKLRMRMAVPELVHDFGENGNITGVRMGVMADGTLFAGGELDCRIHAVNGKEQAAVSVLDPSGTLDNTLSQVSLSADKKHLYVSNRGQDNIAVFDIGSGNLTNPRWFASGGKTPRYFELHEGYLLCANQNSDNIVIFAIEDNGNLTEIQTISAPTVTAIAFRA